MKNKFMLAVGAGVLALTGLSANANTIVVGPITQASDGGTGVLWTYPIIFDNDKIDPTQPTSFNLNDFGPLKTTGPLASGFSFSPGIAYTLTTPLVGPNFGLSGFHPNNPAVSDVVITFTAAADLGGGSETFNLVLDTALTGTGGLANFFAQDIVSTGSLAGTPNAVQQNIAVPTRVVPTAVPEPGTLFLVGSGVVVVARRYRRRSRASS